MKKPGLIITEIQRDAWESLTDEQAGKLVKILLNYQFDDVIPDNLPPDIRMAFSFLRPVIDKQREDYNTKCQKAKEAIKTRWANANERIPPNTDEYERIPPNTDDTNRIELNRTELNRIEKNNIPPLSPYSASAGGKKTGKRFSRPSVEDVSEYIAEKGYTVDAQHFIDYYEANGWKVGRNPMRDWRAAVRTWQQREQADTRTTGKPQQPDGVTLGAGEWIEPDGRRTYGTGRYTVPIDAPARPSERYGWDSANRTWIL